jgi:SAM-dependent methyltransferase
MDKQTQKELLGIIKKNYKEIAGHYNETRKKHLEPLWSRLVEYAQAARDGSKILDAGCGNGRLIEAFTGKEIKYLGIDDSRELVDFARKQKPGRDFRCLSILELGLIPETDFDLVFSVAVLHHLPGRDLQIQALRQLRNKVTADGKIIITVWNMWSEAWQKKKFRVLIWKFWLLKLLGKNKMDFGDILVDWKNSAGEKISQRYYHAFRKGELRRLAKKTGLKIEKLFSDQYNYYLVLRK